MQVQYSMVSMSGVTSSWYKRTQVVSATGENSPSFSCLQTKIGWKSVPGAPKKSPTPQPREFLPHHCYQRAPQIIMMNPFSEYSHLLNSTINMNLDISISLQSTCSSHTLDHRRSDIFSWFVLHHFSQHIQFNQSRKNTKKKLHTQREQKQKRKNMDSLFEFMFFKSQTRSF